MLLVLSNGLPLELINAAGFSATADAFARDPHSQGLWFLYRPAASASAMSRFENDPTMRVVVGDRGIDRGLPKTGRVAARPSIRRTTGPRGRP